MEKDWKEILIKWLEEEEENEYVGGYYNNFEDNICLDGWFNLKELCEKIVSSNTERVKKETLSQIGFLRQWLNEDRITDVNKMVTNEELLIWFNNIK